MNKYKVINDFKEKIEDSTVDLNYEKLKELMEEYIKQTKIYCPDYKDQYYMGQWGEKLYISTPTWDQWKCHSNYGYDYGMQVMKGNNSSLFKLGVINA